MQISAPTMRDLRPMAAIVIYGAGTNIESLTGGYFGTRQGSAMAASLHAVEANAKGRSSLKPGRTLTESNLREALEALIGSSGLKYCEPALLASDRHAEVWWVKPARRTLFVKCVETSGTDYDTLETLALEVPVPGLVMSLRSNGLVVAAVKGHERPAPATPLFRAPFANVYDNGAVCMGTVSLAKRAAAAEAQFFDSVFTHDVGAVRRVKEHAFSWQAWCSLAKSPRETEYPEEWLVSTNTALAGFLARGGQL